MSFLYYLPNETRGTINREDLRAYGLEHADDPGVSMPCLPNQPNPMLPESAPERGLLLTIARGQEARVELDIANQNWRWGPKKKWAVGFWKDKPPTPSQLSRKKKFAGEPVRLRDKNEWLVPYANVKIVDSCQLTKVYDVDDDGNYIETLDPVFHKLGDAALKYLEVFLAQGDISKPDMLDLAILALSTNYRVGKVEVMALLHLLGTDEANDVARAAIDAWGVEDMLKKFAGSPGGSPESSDNI